MGIGGGTGSVPRTVQELLVAAGPDLKNADGTLCPGASLLLAMACRRHKLALDAGGLARLAEFLDLPREEVEKVLVFHDRAAVADSRSVTPLTFCLGINCTLHGAKQLQRRYLQGLKSGGHECSVQEVYCLEHCLLGPSILLDHAVYCGRSQRVLCEERTWRPEGAGPIPLGDESVPVLD